MNPKKRRLLLKILAMRLFIGDRNVASANNLEDAIRMDQKKGTCGLAGQGVLLTLRHLANSSRHPHGPEEGCVWPGGPAGAMLCYDEH